MKQGILSLLVVVCLLAGLLPMEAFAAGTGKEIQLGTNEISGYDSTNGYDYIYYGKWEGNPIKWRVLDTKTNMENDAERSGLFLLSEALLGTGMDGDVYFDNSERRSNEWQGSDAQAWCKDFAGIEGTSVDDAFSTGELDAILATTKSDKEYTSTNNVLFSASNNILNGDKVFFLSAEEAENSAYGFTDRNARVAYYGGSAGVWWFRSPDANRTFNAGVAYFYGFVDVDVVDYPWASRPAFNLDLSSVLFSSVISENVGATDEVYKLTLLDSGMTVQVPDGQNVTRNGDNVTVPYEISGSNAGNATQISLLVTDKEYTAGNTNGAQVIAYEKLTGDSFQKNGTCTFTLSDKIKNDNYYFYILAEDINGSMETDYASVPMKVEMLKKQIDGVELTLDVPAVGQELAATVGYSTTGVGNVTVEWTDAKNNAVSGNADFNTSYTAQLIVTPANEYYFAAVPTVTVNGEAVTADAVTLNMDGTLTVTKAFERTAKAKLTGITDPPPITGVENGTAKTVAALGLPASVEIVTEDTRVTSAVVTWDLDNLADGSYDPSELTEQTFTVNGTITLPAEIDANNIELRTQVIVTVAAAGTVAAPKASPAAGTYTENQNVVLSGTTAGAEIYYTTDGSTPTKTSTRYAASIEVKGTPGTPVTTTIRAVAVKDGMKDSAVVEFIYVIDKEAEQVETTTYTVNVTNGTLDNGKGSGSYKKGDTVMVSANVPAQGQTFKSWNVTKGSITLADVYSAITTFLMPDGDVELTAEYTEAGNNQEENKENGVDTQPTPAVTPHTCEWKWIVTRNANAKDDGEEVCYCVYCGAEKARQSISAFGYFCREVLGKIEAAPENGTVEITTDRWISYPAYILKALEERPDVTLVTNFRYQGKDYRFTIPTRKAGTTAGGLVEEGVNWYGYLYLGDKYGLTEITGEKAGE